MSYRALYRVWRPQQFTDLVGQEHVTTTLKNALASGQLAHAYLFHGPRGTGKTSAAKILSKAVNCEQGPAAEPCNQCDACRKITDGQMIDVVEIDAASNRGVDDIRELREQVKYAPTEARYKVYIIDEAHMLTLEAFNALLKTLEEPPAHVLFLLATTEPHKLLPTILSRCQRFAFRRITFKQIVATLEKICTAEGVTYEASALRLLARSADGGLRDALSLLDQALAFAGQQLDEMAVTAVTGSGTKKDIYQLLQAVEQQKTVKVVELLQECLLYGAEPERIMEDLIYTCRDVMLNQTAPQLDFLREKEDRELQQLSRAWTTQKLVLMMETLLSYQQQMKQVTHPYLLLETVLIRLSQEGETEKPNQGNSDDVAALRKELQQLRKQVQDWQQTEPISLVKEESSRSPGRQPIVPAENRALSPETLQKIKRSWSEILLRVKERKITIHAWLINGEPVGATNDHLILLFSSKIHRDTVERPENRQEIEQVIQEVTGFSLLLQCVLKNEWNEQSSQAATIEEEDHPAQSSEQPSESTVLARAIQIFGHEWVEKID